MSDYSDMDIEDGGKFLRVKGGEMVDIHILSTKPKKMLVHGFGKERLSCAGDGCNMCEEGAVSKQRWMINVFDRKSKTVKIYEFGTTVARQIKAIAEMLDESQQTIHDIDLRIKADGSGMNTEYTVMQKPMASPIPDGLKLLPL